MRKNNEQPLKDVIDEMLRVYRLDNKYRKVEISRAWEEVMGTIVSKKTRDMYFKDKALIVRIDSGVMKEEFSYAKEKIRKMLNKHLGYEAITSIEIR